MHYLEKELKELIKEDESVFDFLQKSTLDGLWYWDLKNPDEEWMNSTFWEILGYDPDEMPHKVSSWMGIIYPEDLEIASQKIAEHMEHQERPYDQITRYRHADGHTVWIRCRGVIMRDADGTPMRMLGAHTDVTEVNRKGQILERCNTAAMIGYWEVDFENTRISYSSMTRKICEVPTDYEPVFGNLFPFLKKGVHQKRVDDAISDAKKLNREQKVEALIETGEGNEKWVGLYIIPEFRGGECVSIFGTFQDIDQRVRASMRVEELLKKTEKQNDRLMNFAHTISHNLRSQVGGVNSMIEVMELEYPDIVENELFTYLKSASQKLAQTVVHLSEIAVGDEFSEKDYEQLKLRDIAESCIRAQINFEELSIVEIKNQVPENLQVHAILGYLESIFDNLITNAIKYRDPDKSAYVKIDAGLNEENNSVWFTVEDNGLGIDLVKYGSKLFKLYTTFHGNEDSSGIGLFATKNQIHAMDGSIEVESEPGKGSTFKVFLPIRNSSEELISEYNILNK